LAVSGFGGQPLIHILNFKKDMTKSLYSRLPKALLFNAMMLVNGTLLTAQALPIVIDSQFDDWTSEAIETTDASGDGSNIDLLRFEVANDESHLFLQLETAEEINLTDGHKLTLFLDTDLDANTGTSIGGIGADLQVRLGEREAFYQLPSGQGYLSLNDLIFRHQPTVTSTIFEISLDLSAESNAGFSLFNANGVRIFWKDNSNNSGDEMPESGNVFTYTFDETPTPAIVPIDLEKDNLNAVRLLSWNTLQTGLDDSSRTPFFDRVLGVLQPDIVTFNECWDINAAQVATFMNAAVPLPNFQSWHAVKLDQGNITASRYPILQSWLIFPGHRLTASLIDIPSGLSDKDLLVVNGHLRCCDNNYERQREADAFVQFIQDAKTSGGEIDLPADTPFLLSGDMNLVGDRQQLTTLLTGDVVNSGQFGPGGPMDWDGTELKSVISRHSDDRLSYTWRNDFSSYPPSRIDYQIISKNIQIAKTFTLETSSMPADRLALYGLQQFDVETASDHLPKVADALLPLSVASSEQQILSKVMLSPNPSKGLFHLNVDLPEAEEMTCSIFDATGSAIFPLDQPCAPNKTNFEIDLSGYPAGLYFLKIKTGTGVAILKMMKL